MEEVVKIIKWTYFHRSLCLLIPKKRGDGFLRQPYGHHFKLELHEALENVTDADLFGLDGYLEVAINTADYNDPDYLIAAPIVEALVDHYGFKSESVTTGEFFDLLKTNQFPQSKKRNQ